jgi:hypothetical protein
MTFFYINSFSSYDDRDPKMSIIMILLNKSKMSAKTKQLCRIYQDVFIICVLFATVLITDIVITPSTLGFWRDYKVVSGFTHLRDFEYVRYALLHDICKSPEECSDIICHAFQSHHSNGTYRYDVVGVELLNRHTCDMNDTSIFAIPYFWAYITATSMFVASTMIAGISTILYTCWCDQFTTLSYIFFIANNVSMIALRFLQIIYWTESIKDQALWYMSLQIALICAHVIMIFTHRVCVHYFCSCHKSTESIREYSLPIHEYSPLHDTVNETTIVIDDQQ